MAVPLTLLSVPAQTPYIQYIATSSQTVFPYPFEITQDADLVVLINGVRQATDSGYTLSGQGATGGGNVTFTLGQTAGAIITLYRNISIARITQLAQNGTFFSANFNNEYNRIYLIMQQLQEATSFCLQVPNTNNPAPVTTLTPAAYANKYLAFDSNGNPTPALLTSSGSLTQQIIAGLYQPQTAAEVAASVTPVNFQYAPGVVDRYLTNSTPGTTDMGPALQSAINVALAAPAGTPIRFGPGAYSIATLPTFGTATTLIIPIDIGGAGDALTQLIHNGTASTAPLFQMSGRNGWAIHDLMITGNSTHKNDGIYAGAVGGAEQILWRVENVTSYMAGVGLQVADTNDGVVRRFKHWPNNGLNTPSPGTGTLPVAQSVTASDIGHGIHVTGGFANMVSFYDCVTQPSTNFFGGSNAMRGILIDCTSSVNLGFYNCDVETYGGASGTEVGFAITSSSAVEQLTVMNLYQEGTQVQLLNTLFSTFINMTDGTTSTSGNSIGALVLNSACRQNTFIGVSLNTVNESSSSNYGNIFQTCNFRTSWTDSSTGPVDRRINCLLAGGMIRDWGGTDAVSVTIPASSPNQAPNAFVSNYYRYVENSSSAAFTIAAPTNPVIGFEMTIVIVNASGGSGVQPTFASGYHMLSNTNTPAVPGNGLESTFKFKYNGTSWQQLAAPATAVPD